MLELLIAALGAAALLGWHMQRPDPPRLQLSFARLLPDPPPQAGREPRFAWRLPLASPAFWLRIAAMTLILAAMALAAVRVVLPGDAGIGLRVLVDVTASMGLPDEGGTRLDQAKAIAAKVEEQARQAATAGFCAEVILVGGRAAKPAPLDQAAVLPEGGDPGILTQAALAAPTTCAITHALVLSDLPRPAVVWPEDAPTLIWDQVGPPVANAGLRGVIFRRPGLAAHTAALVIEVVKYGDGEDPKLWLDGPAGRAEAALTRASDRDAVWLAEVPFAGPGHYRAALQGGGAFGGDDRVDFDLTEADQVRLDWQVVGMPQPKGTLSGGGQDVWVGDVLDLPVDTPGRALLVTYPGWRNGGGAGQIGAFVEDAALLGTINLDVFETAGPQPFAGPLPAGFHPVLTDASGAVFVARRSIPPGILVPAPDLTKGDAVAALSLSLFFAALSDLTSNGHTQPDLHWVDPAGVDISDAWKESDTARPLAPEPDMTIAPRVRAGLPTPLWPWLVVLALLMLVAERCIVLGGILKRTSRVL
jgi:hypothetical protein